MLLTYQKHAYQNAPKAVCAADALNQILVTVILDMLEPIVAFNAYAMDIQIAKDPINWTFVWNAKTIPLASNARCVHHYSLVIRETMVNVFHAPIIVMVTLTCAWTVIQIAQSEV